MSVKRKVDSITQIKEEKRKVQELEDQNRQLSQQVTELQLALCDVYEIVVGGATNG